MKIIGYSERGAMNALFYGMALDKEQGEESLKRFINELALIPGEFSDFELYNEFSLSDFGDPDFMIKAKDEKGQDVIFFIEAKASCCKYYNLQKQKTHHEDYMDDGNYDKGHASNLYFQLRLKHYFYNILPYFLGDDDITAKQDSFFNEEYFKDYSEAKKNRLKQSGDRYRKIGENVIVEKIVKTLQDCKEAYYIAIIPEQEQEDNNKIGTEEFGFETHTIIWEDLYLTFKNYLDTTISFNQNTGNKKNKVVNQILNKPIKYDK